MERREFAKREAEVNLASVLPAEWSRAVTASRRSHLGTALDIMTHGPIIPWARF